MAFNPMAIPTACPKTNIPAMQERLLLLQEARNKANAAHELARQKMMEQITQGFTPFEVGEKVWLELKHFKLRHESKKLAPKQEGPFKITEVLNTLNYRLLLPKKLAYPPGFPRIPSISIQRKRRTRRELSRTTTRACRRRARI